MESMGELMKSLKEEIEFFTKKIEYIIPLIITAILSFGFVITHYSVNIDTLSSERYFREGELLTQHRFGGVLLDKIFGVMEYNPFFVDCLAVIFLIMASIAFCILFKKISNNKVNIVAYTIFSCLFVSYPLINEIFSYTPMSFLICFSFFITAIVLNLLYSYRKNNKIRNLVYAGLLMCLIISAYESSAPVLLCGFFIIEILDCIYNNRNKKIREAITNLVIMIIPFVSALIIYSLVSNLILMLWNIMPGGSYPAKEIMYKELGLIGGIKNLIDTIFYNYIVNAFLYLPITIMLISCVIMFILGIVYGIKRKNVTIFLLFLGSISTLFLLSILQGSSALYRTCQVFQIFSAFAFMILIQSLINLNKAKLIKNICICLMFLVIFYQAKDLNKYFYLNYTRYEQEKIALTSMAEQLKLNYDIKNKPVVFIARYSLSNYIKERCYIKTDTLGARMANILVSVYDPNNKTYSEENEYIYKPIDSNINSYLNWSAIAFNEVNTEMLKWLDILGYDYFKQGTQDMLKDAIKKILSKEVALERNSIYEFDDYIFAII